jgi:hypothetical protein
MVKVCEQMASTRTHETRFRIHIRVAILVVRGR